MELSRRQLLVLVSAATVGGCTHGGGEGLEGPAPAFTRGPVDAGPVRDYSHDGIYSGLRDSGGFFVIRQRNRLFARSAMCTHRTCKLNVSGGGFLCPCHGSTFTVDGHVTRGPARRDLPGFVVEKSAQGHLIVHTDRPLSADQLDTSPGFVDVD